MVPKKKLGSFGGFIINCKGNAMGWVLWFYILEDEILHCFFVQFVARRHVISVEELDGFRLGGRGFSRAIPSV